MVNEFGKPQYNPADPRNGTMKDLWSQVQLMRIHKEVETLLMVLPDEYQDSELELSLKEVSIRCLRKILPEFHPNPLLYVTEGTPQWDKAMQGIVFLYMQL